jgi:hypothetical protein
VSAADPQWPAWLRRHTGVELLGPPRLFFAWLTIALSLLMIVYVGAWNAAKYPIVLGYDAQPNAAYAHILLDQHHIPHPDQSEESSQPPGYFFVAEIAARAGHEIFGWLEARPFSAQLPEASYRGAQILNVALVFATALILLALARIVAPGRPEVWAASTAFFAFLPVVSKTAAMFHPETMNMFLSAVALLIATKIMQSRRLELRRVILLALVLLAGFLVRSSTLFTLIAILAGLAIVFARPAIRAHLSRRAMLAMLTILLTVVGSGWLLVNRSPDIGSVLRYPGVRTAVTTRSDFADLSLGTMFRAPYRPNFVNAALPTTYTEIWGDWIGAFAWSPDSGVPSPPAVRILRDQNWIGVLPTFLAIAGWLAIAWRTMRRRTELIAVVLLPVVVLVGYLFRSYQFLSADGDLFKASYLLTTAPVWALGFGVAWGALGRYRRARVGVAACLCVFAVLELRFMLYGVRDNFPIF